MERIEENYFTKEALDRLKKDVEMAFSGWKSVEIITHSFYKMDDGLIFSETDLFANDAVHKITLKFHKNSDSWSRGPNSIEHLGIKRPV